MNHVAKSITRDSPAPCGPRRRAIKIAYLSRICWLNAAAIFEAPVYHAEFGDRPPALGPHISVEVDGEIGEQSIFCRVIDRQMDSRSQIGKWTGSLLAGRCASKAGLSWSVASSTADVATRRRAA